MKIKLKKAEQSEQVAKRMAYLAWKASSVFGMGVLQDRGDVDEDAFWESAINEADYPGGRARDGQVDCDYVNGRMMKWWCNWSGKEVSPRDTEFRGDYQSFCGTYPDARSLAQAALDELGIDGAEIVEEQTA